MSAEVVAPTHQDPTAITVETDQELLEIVEENPEESDSQRVHSLQDVDDAETAKSEEEEEEDFFNKHTASFRCLEQILISRSSLLRHPLRHFPPLEDPGLDEAFNYIRKSHVAILNRCLKCCLQRRIQFLTIQVARNTGPCVRSLK